MEQFHFFECKNPIEEAGKQQFLLQLSCELGEYAWDLISRSKVRIAGFEVVCGDIIVKGIEENTGHCVSFSTEDISERWMLTEPSESDYLI